MNKLDLDAERNCGQVAALAADTTAADEGRKKENTKEQMGKMPSHHQIAKTLSSIEKLLFQQIV